MNSNSRRLLLFPRVNEAIIKEQKAIKASKLKIEIEHDMRRNKTTSLYNLYEKSSSEEPIQSISNIISWALKDMALDKQKLVITKIPYQTHLQESKDDYEYINESNLLHRRSIQIVRDKHQIKRFITEQKPQSNFNSQPQTQNLKQFFKVKPINIEQNITLSPRLQNMNSLRKNLKRKARIKIQLNGDSSRRKVETKLMSLNGWKTQEDELILNE